MITDTLPRPTPEGRCSAPVSRGHVRGARGDEDDVHFAHELLRTSFARFFVFRPQAHVLHGIFGSAEPFQLAMHEADELRAASDPPSDGVAMRTALAPFRVTMMLLMGVADGFVTGVIAPTTPTGLAISVMPLSASRWMTPIRLGHL